jgi:PQQ-dependent catabolism-associated CXXCW motif protein
MRSRFVLALAAALAVIAPALGDSVPEPTGYRLDDYRAPVPATIAGGTVLDTQQLEVLIAAGGAVLIDVLPAPARPANMAPAALWLPKARHNIPGSVWLPDLGHGHLSAALEAYFVRQLASLSGADKAKPLVFYCLADCWMSWNAAKRAIAHGYGRVYWYPAGTDGWADAGNALAASTPLRRDE